MENTKSANGRDILHNADNYHLPQAQKYFSSLRKEEQTALIEKFKSEKITSDILKIIYKKEGIEGTIMNVMFFNYLSKINV